MIALYMGFLHPHPPYGVGKCTGKPIELYGLFEFEVWGIEQDLIPYMGQLVLSKVSNEEWCINLYAYNLLDGLCDVVQFSTHNGEIVYIGLVIFDVARS